MAREEKEICMRMDGVLRKEMKALKVKRYLLKKAKMYPEGEIRCNIRYRISELFEVLDQHLRYVRGKVWSYQEFRLYIEPEYSGLDEMLRREFMRHYDIKEEWNEFYKEKGKNLIPCIFRRRRILEFCDIWDMRQQCKKYGIHLKYI
jgi:hypothetical protein